MRLKPNCLEEGAEYRLYDCSYIRPHLYGLHFLGEVLPTRYCFLLCPWYKLWVCHTIILGGLLISSACVCFQVQSYDPDTNSWLLRATIPIAKRCITAVSLNNLIYVAGGLTKAIYCYDPIEDYWMHVQNTFSRQVIKHDKACKCLKGIGLHEYLGRKWIEAHLNLVKLHFLIPSLLYFFIYIIGDFREEAKLIDFKLRASVSQPSLWEKLLLDKSVAVYWITFQVSRNGSLSSPVTCFFKYKLKTVIFL